jgi:hypothetical protein
MYTGMLLIPTSTNAKIESTMVNINDMQAIKYDPFVPTFLPKNPDIIEANKGSVIIIKYII